jgi:hypothetical protein
MKESTSNNKNILHCRELKEYNSGMELTLTYQLFWLKVTVFCDTTL